MNTTVLYIGASLDGFIAGPNDDLSWLDPYHDVEYGYEEFFLRIGAIILGRRTYDIEVQRGWEDAHPVPKFVLSRDSSKQKPSRDDITFTHDDIADVLKASKKMTDKDIWIEGGANVAQQFLKRGILDEIIITIVPVILGGGIRLFDNIGAEIPLKLQEVKRFDKGLVQLAYTFIR